MKKKICYGALVVGLFALMFACQQEGWLSVPFGIKKTGWTPPSQIFQGLDEQAWLEAQALYELHKNEVEVFTKSDGHHPLFEDMAPLWNRSFTCQGKGKVSVETELWYSSLREPILRECYEKYLETSDKRYLRTSTRLIVLTYEDGREPVLFFMTLSPSVEYLEMTNFYIYCNSYLVRDAHFSGQVHFYNLSGEYVNGWVYGNGEVIASLHANLEDEVQTRAITQVCDPVIERQCQQTDLGGDITDETGEATVTAECEDVIVGEYCYYVDDGLDGGSSGSGGHGGSSGHGGSGGGGDLGGYEGETPEQSTLCMSDDLKKLFQCHYLDAKNIAKLSAGLAAILENPAYKKLFDEMTADLAMGESLFNAIKIDPNTRATAAVSITANGEVNLKFCGEYAISEESIQHEFYHLYQVFHNHISIGSMMTACSLNMEFEQALFQDIVKYVEIRGAWDARDENNVLKYDHKWACWEYNPLGGTIGNQADYMDWLGSLTHNGTKYPVNIDRKEFNEWTLFFRSVKTAYVTFGFDENYCLTVLDALN